MDQRFKELDPFFLVNERVDVKVCVKLPVATEESDREATPNSNVTTECTEYTDTTDDGETVPTSKKPISGSVSSLFADMSRPKKDSRMVFKQLKVSCVDIKMKELLT